LEKTAEKAVSALAEQGIPSLVCGGLAVQEYGYPRMTHDVDIIVPNVPAAYAVLSLAGFRPSRETPGRIGFMVDRETKIELDLLPAAQSISGPVSFPTPHTVTQHPTLVSLSDLISLKLGSYLGTPMQRLKDRADVHELIQRRKLPRNFHVHAEVSALWFEIWDGLKAEADKLKKDRDK